MNSPLDSSAPRGAIWGRARPSPRSSVEAGEPYEFHGFLAPHTTEAPGLVRHWLIGHLIDHVPDHVMDDAALLASELATNAVQHGLPATEVTLEITHTSIRVAVIDMAPAIPTMQPITMDRPQGRGLNIVDALAATWGVETRGDVPGKTVWFTLNIASVHKSGR